MSRPSVKEGALAGVHAHVVAPVQGVGSHAAHLLLRSGVGRLRLIDFDQVSLSSLNRHAVATRADVGMPKAICLQVCALVAEAVSLSYKMCTVVTRNQIDLPAPNAPIVVVLFIFTRIRPALGQDGWTNSGAYKQYNNNGFLKSSR